MRIGGLKINDEQVLIWGGVAALLILFGPKLAKVVAQRAVGVASDVAAGAVIGAGEVVGIPTTDQSKCQQDIAAGNSWDASFDCTASEFIDYEMGNKP